jgi:hypothetical protein
MGAGCLCNPDSDPPHPVYISGDGTQEVAVYTLVTNDPLESNGPSVAYKIRGLDDIQSEEINYP